MPRGRTPQLPREHHLKLSDDESRLMGLLWDRFVMEYVGELATVIDIVGCLNLHIQEIRRTKGDEYLVDLWQRMKDRFDTLWEIHGCACGDPNCGHNKDNPDNQLGGFGGLDIEKLN